MLGQGLQKNFVFSIRQVTPESEYMDMVCSGAGEWIDCNNTAVWLCTVTWVDIIR